MPYIETEIWMALKGAFTSLPGGRSIAVGDELFEKPLKPDGSPAEFLHISDLRGDPIRASLSGKVSILRGTLQVMLMVPVGSSVKHSYLMNEGGVIANHFAPERRLKFGSACLRVAAHPSVVQPFREGAYHQVPVRINWRTD